MVTENEIKPIVKGYSNLIPFEQMEKVASLFGSYMQRIVKNMKTKIADLDLLSDEDQKIIGEWNKKKPERVDKCVHELIQDQCRLQPASTAVDAWDGSWTYEQLNTFASSLSYHLQAQGVCSDKLVPILMDKSRWAPVALFAVLKAGGAFVLLDPTQPLQRLQDICADIRPDVIIVSPNYYDSAAALTKTVIRLDDENQPQLETQTQVQCEDRVTENEVQPHHAAYAVFTSGSTGKPKGVIIEHSCLSTTALAVARKTDIDSNSRVLNYASHAFDASVADLAISLVAGACICIPSLEGRQNALLETMNQFCVTYIALTPSVARTLQPKQLSTLKTLVLGGEALTQSDIDLWSSAPGIQLINIYGPAECTIDVTSSKIRHSGPQSVTIGHTIGNATAWIVDPANHHAILPIGAIGELMIQGPAVGRRYINRPEQTSATFVNPPNWLSKFRTIIPGEKLYKTGDLVQYAADGSLKYHGRKDCQVKLRGQRFELGEVEQTLRLVFPRASDVIAEVASVNNGRSKALAAYVCQDSWDNELDGTPVTKDHLRDTENILEPPSESFYRAVASARVHLGSLLPTYMEPTIYLPLSSIPRTRSGKVDRSRLKELVSSGLHEKWANNKRSHWSRAPRNEVELTLRKAFAEALDIPADQIGAEDHFFRLGGDSVVAMILVGLIRKYGYDATVGDIFECPRLEALAERVGASVRDVKEKYTVPEPFSLLKGSLGSRELFLEQAELICNQPKDQIEDIYPCGPLQGRLFLFSTVKQGAWAAKFAFDLPANVDVERLQAAWVSVSSAHPILRSRIIKTEDEELYQVVLRDCISFEHYEAPESDYKDLPDLTVEVAVGKPLLRVALIRIPSSGTHRLILSLHHAVYDGWGLPQLMSELERAYKGAVLEPRPFSPFIAHLAQISSSSAQFWKTELQGKCFPIFPQKPASYQPSPHAVLSRRVDIPSVNGAQFTVSTKVRWALAKAISLYSDNASDIMLLLATAGRGSSVVGIDKLIAPTLASMPYLVHIDQSQTVFESLQASQLHYSKTLPHEHFGMTNICQMIPGPKNPEALQTLLVIQPQPPASDLSMFMKRDLPDEGAEFHTRVLSIHCHLHSSSMELVAYFDPELFSPVEAERFLEVFDSIFRQICHEPEVQISKLDTDPNKGSRLQ